MRESHPLISIVSNPEFLRESTAVNDFFCAPFYVAGGDDKCSVDTVLSLYEDVCPYKRDLSGALEGCDGVVVCKDLLSEADLHQMQLASISIYDLGDVFRKPADSHLANNQASDTRFIE